MKTEIGEMIGASRTKMGLTQDQFGKKYNVSGPAIFKFEKSYVKPSLDLWMLMAKDMKIAEKEAVLTWVRAKLPKRFQPFVTLQTAATREQAKKYKTKGKKLPSPDAARRADLGDRSAPKGLKQLLKDDDIWTLYKPKTEEIDVLKEVFGKMGAGSKSAYREALRLVREFNES